MSKMQAKELHYLTDYVLANAATYPDKIAIVHDDVSLTWLELAEQMQAAAVVLSAQLPSDRQAVVGMLLANSWQFVVAYLGVLHAGHIVMPFDPTFKLLENESIIEQIETAFVITDAEFIKMFGPQVRLIMAHDVVGKAVDRPLMPGKDYFRLDPSEQVATLLFTSGTTGKPKATPYTHANHLWNVMAVTDLWQWTAEDTILCSLPLSHWHGLTMALSGAIKRANTLYVQTRFDAEVTLAL